MKAKKLILPLLCLFLFSCAQPSSSGGSTPSGGDNPPVVDPDDGGKQEDEDQEGEKQEGEGDDGQQQDDKKDENITSISVTGPTKKTYQIGEAADYTGLKVIAFYKDGQTGFIAVDKVTISGFDSSKANDNLVITVKYLTFSTTFKIKVIANEKTLSSISVISPTKTSYFVGDSLDTTGMKVTAKYSDNSTENISLSDVSISGFSSVSAVASQTVTVTYQGKTATFTVSINEKPAEKLDPRNEPYIGNQYYLNNIGDIYTVWEKYRGSGVTIAVIDGSFKCNHEDFYYKDGTSKVSSKSAYFHVSSGSVQTEVGTSKVLDQGDSEYSHGTYCAGVAAAAVNGKGVAGVAPDATLMLLRTDFKPASINAAFKYAADNGAKVVTISIGSYNHGDGDLDDGGIDLTTAFDNAVAYCRSKGVVVCSAAGNGGPSECNKPTEYTYPGATTGVIGVGGLAANSTGEIWSGSSYNYVSPEGTVSQFVDVMAPSHSMYGCSNYGSTTYDGGWNKWNGTSFASPIVAGMAALYFEKYPNKGVIDFENALYGSCYKMDDDTNAYPNKYGYGRVDVARLLGEKASSNIVVNLTANWSSAYVYAWGYDINEEYRAWPGLQMTKSGNTFTATIDASKYDSLVFTNGSNTTVNLLTSSFLNGHSYSVTSGYKENGQLVGLYSK